jgi:DNA repair protein RadC
MTTTPATEYVVGHCIRDRHADERPRERLLKFFPAALSNSDLIAVLV